jgi:hypothetical protein
LLSKGAFRNRVHLDNQSLKTKQTPPVILPQLKTYGSEIRWGGFLRSYLI